MRLNIPVCLRLNIPVCLMMLAGAAAAAYTDDCPSPEDMRQMNMQNSKLIAEGEATIELIREEITILEEILLIVDDPALHEDLKMLRVDERTLRSNLDRLLRDIAALRQHCS